MPLAARIPEAFENVDSMALTLCDLSQIFDCVPHSILLSKLKMYGVQEISHQT